MSYDLKPVNKDLETFEFGAFSFPHILQACGCLFPTKHYMGTWEMPSEVSDKRYEGVHYPPELSNDGFKVTAFEAKVMAICVRNYANLQKGKDFREDWITKFELFAEWAENSRGFRIF